MSLVVQMLPLRDLTISLVRISSRRTKKCEPVRWQAMRIVRTARRWKWCFHGLENDEDAAVAGKAVLELLAA
jgi:hypothetical protein